jgi:hypothetical protein
VIGETHYACGARTATVQPPRRGADGRELALAWACDTTKPGAVGRAYSGRNAYLRALTWAAKSCGFTVSEVADGNT